MALITQRPKGTQDTVPADAYKWQTVESLARDVITSYSIHYTKLYEFSLLIVYNIPMISRGLSSANFIFNTP